MLFFKKESATSICRKENNVDSNDRRNDAIVNLDDGDLLLTEVQGLPHPVLAVSHPAGKQEQTITKTKKKNMQTSDKIDLSEMQMHWELISEEK